LLPSPPSSLPFSCIDAVSNNPRISLTAGGDVLQRIIAALEAVITGGQENRRQKFLLISLSPALTLSRTTH
jgi:hypothetical protein